MDTSNHLAALRRDAPALLDAAERADPAVKIEACPEWTPVDLAWHIGEVHEFWATIVRERCQSRDEVGDGAQRPDSVAGVFDFARSQASALVDALGSADPTTEVWTWSTDHDVTFVTRRMAQETAVHQWDAARAAGTDVEIDPALAADGVDEFLFEHFVRWASEGAAAAGGSVHLHCTDTPGEWLVREATAGDSPYLVTREHAKGDAAIRGTASDLVLALWRRRPLDALDVVGDEAVARRFVGHTDND